MVQQPLGAVPGGVGGETDALQPGGDGISAGLGVVDGGLHQVVQGVQLPPQPGQGVAVGAQGQIGLRLSGNAAHVLPAQDGAVVDAVRQIPGLAARDAAHVVAHMGIAHGAAVDAALDGAAGIARHAAGVGVAVQQGVALLPLIAGELAQAAADVFQVRGGIMLDGVHLGIVFAFQQEAQVPPGDAAGGVQPLHGAGSGAAGNFSRLVVPAHDAAHGLVALDDAPEGAALDSARVDACDAAHKGAAAVGGHSAGDMEIPHHRALLDIAEQAHPGAAGVDAQAGDGVSVPQEGAAEGGDGGEVHGGQVDVRRQADGLALGPGVQRAVLGEAHQLLGGGDGDFTAVGPGRRLGKAHQQPYRQQQGGELTHGCFHRHLPPFRSGQPEAPAARPAGWIRPPQRR